MLKSAQTKIAFTGTNSSGKTTMAMKVTAILKEQHHQLAELVSSQDRKITWKDAHFPVNPIAHYGMITNLIHAEVQATLKGDADIIVTDRSVLDLYAIALYDHPDSLLIKNMEPMIKAWASTYSQIYLLQPLEYQEDGKRPSDSFRMATFATLTKYLSKNPFPNVRIDIPRDAVVKEIRQYLGLQEIKPVFEEDAKFKELAELSESTFIVKPNRYGSSDLDVWYFPISIYTCTGDLKDHQSKLNALSKLIFGEHIAIDLMLLPRSVNLDKYKDSHKIFNHVNP